MSIFKKIASFFSAPVVEVPAATVDSKQAFADQELTALKAELAAKNKAVDAVQAELMSKGEAEAKKRQTGQALQATYRALDLAEDKLEVLQEQLCHAEESDSKAGDELVELAIRLRQERMERKLNKLGGAPVPRYISPTPRVWNTPITPITPAASNSVVCPACNTPNHEANTHCDACGGLLVQPAPTTTPTNAPAPTSVPPVVTGTLPFIFNVSQNQQQITN